jgi:DeoR/GlpR family transcriptional regulator of sugar metabolism
VRQAPEGAALLCSGGLFREVSQTFVGPQAMQFFEGHHANVAFISATGLDRSDGLTDPNPLEIEVKRALCRRADRIVLLLDHSKFGRRSLMPVLPLRDVDYLITDTPLSRSFAAELARSKVQVEVVRA